VYKYSHCSPLLENHGDHLAAAAAAIIVSTVVVVVVVLLRVVATITRSRVAPSLTFA
jgi:hypothetical protein